MASYGTNPAKLERAVASLQKHSVTDWRLFLIHNPSEGDGLTRDAVTKLADDANLTRPGPGVIWPIWMPENVGYAGAVNKLLQIAETEYIAYLDYDTEIDTPGWDETLASYLDRFHELGLVFPNWGHNAIPRGAYNECLWAAGFSWMVSRMAQREVGLFDTALGHHEEVDFCTRVKLAGYRLACVPEVRVSHHETSTRSPESQERIAAGVRRWVDKWAAYFGGKAVNYHSPNVLRILDWNVHALHMEDWFKQQPELMGINDNPDSIRLADGSEWDLIRVPRPKGFYRGRII